MDFEVTKKAIKENFSNILKVKYCDAEKLLRYKTPFAYSSGVYVRSCNYYNINGVIICTGHKPIGKAVDYNLVRKYNEKAKKIVMDLKPDWQYKERKVDRLLKKLIKEALKRGAGKM